jgi:Na+/proline symporter
MLAQYNSLDQQYTQAFEQKKIKANELIKAIDSKNEDRINHAQDQLKVADSQAHTIRQNAIELMKKNNPKADDNDTNYVFLTFVTQYLPKGLIGLLIAIIFLASMGSTASALNSLASTSVVDIYKRIVNPATDQNYLNASRLATVFWGVVCIGMALYASRIGNLLEAVNQLGSYIYGTILGVFIVAFYLKRIKGTAVFIAAIITEAIICIMGYYNVIAYLWLNAIGALLLIVIAWTISMMSPSESRSVIDAN